MSSWSPKVITRRQQLGLRAEKKESSQKGKGRGRGRGGRGRGSIPAGNSEKVEEHHDKNNEEHHGDDSGDAPKTPRRRLFGEEGDGHGSSAEVDEKDKINASPEIKQPEKKPRRAKAKAKEKAAAKRPAAATPTKPAAEPEAEGGEAPAVSPPKKPPTKRTKRASKSKDGEKVEDATGAAPEAEGEKPSEKPSEKPGLKMPSDRAIKKAKDEIIEAKSDAASWFFAERLWKSINGKVTKEHPNLKKYEFWQFSMYYGTFRVGLLHKGESGKFRHVLSFGGGHCTDIGLPLEAAYMYVTCLVSTQLCFSTMRHKSQ